MSAQPLKRLLDQAGVLDLERQALLEPQLAAFAARTDPRVQSVSRRVFGYEPQDAPTALLVGVFSDQEEVDLEGEFEPRWKEVEAEVDVDDRRLVALFRNLGWDVTDYQGRPLLVLPHFKYQLYLQAKGLAPEGRPETSTADWQASLEAEARAFRPKR